MILFSKNNQFPLFPNAAYKLISTSRELQGFHGVREILFLLNDSIIGILFLKFFYLLNFG